jgi:hypothetical protein
VEVHAVLILNPGQFSRCIFDRFIPFDFHPFVVVAFFGGILTHPLQGFAQAIRTGVYVLDAGGLGTDISLAENIVLVAAYGEDLLTVVFYLDSAHGFTQVAGAVMKLAHIGSPGVYL